MGIELGSTVGGKLGGAVGVKLGDVVVVAGVGPKVGRTVGGRHCLQPPHLAQVQDSSQSARSHHPTHSPFVGDSVGLKSGGKHGVHPPQLAHVHFSSAQRSVLEIQNAAHRSANLVQIEQPTQELQAHLSDHGTTAH